MLTPLESCDDGSNDSRGCNSSCTGSALGFTCSGGDSTHTSICSIPCGDGIKISPEETCDDGNLTPVDGCDSSCQIETFWSCITPGSPCIPLCGDGYVFSAKGEICDDHNTVNGDGCSSVCT